MGLGDRVSDKECQMRKWLALLMGTALVAVAGTAMALNGTYDTDGEKVATETTVKTEIKKEKPTTTTTEKAEEKPEKVKDGMYDDDSVADKVVKVDDVVDRIPPTIEILHPEDGQVFETKEVVFEGIAEPGSRVFSGDKEAEVGENGEWRLVLGLSKGENVVEVKAIDEAGNKAYDSVKVIVELPKPKEEPKKEEPKEEPKKEEPKEEKEEPKEEEVHWEFGANQLYGHCNEDPPYDVFWGTGKPGTAIYVKSEFGNGVAEVNDNGEWEIQVFFEGAPAGEAFKVKVKDEFGNYQYFEFVHNVESK